MGTKLFWDPQAVAGGLFLNRGGARPKAPKSGTRKKGLRWNWSIFCPENERSPKKRSLPDLERFFLSQKQAFSKKKEQIKRSSLELERFLSRKWLRYRSQGAKVAQGGPKYFQGGSCPPAPLLPAPMPPRSKSIETKNRHKSNTFTLLLSFVFDNN